MNTFNTFVLSEKTRINKLVIVLMISSSQILTAAEGFLFTSRSQIYEAPKTKELNITDEITLEAFIKPALLPRAGGRIIDKLIPGTDTGYLLDTYPGNSLRLITSKGQCGFDAKLPTNEWTHVVAVYSSLKKTMKLFINGKEVASRTDGEFPKLQIAPNNLRIGQTQRVQTVLLEKSKGHLYITAPLTRKKLVTAQKILILPPSTAQSEIGNLNQSQPRKLNHLLEKWLCF
jgi:hypothetical protein